MKRRPAIRREPPSAAEIAARDAALREVVDFADDDLAALPAQALSLPAGAAWLRAGERAHEVGVVLQGALREYYQLADGSERSKSFNLAGDPAGSLADLLSGAPSRTWVVAERPTRLLVAPWIVYQQLVASRPAWRRYAQAVAERLYCAKAEREYELLALDAAGRYRCALRRWPQLESCFSQRDIASYIGITPVHLSRLRAAARRSAPVTTAPRAETAAARPGAAPAPRRSSRARKA